MFRNKTRSSVATWLLGLVLATVPVVVYFPCLKGPFVWDDSLWTIQAEWIMSSFAGLLQIWTVPTSLQQYFPVTATSFWIDHHLWGYNTFPYHLENVMLHSISCLLFWRLLTKLEVKGAWFAATLLAIHPISVESVAWITERKNVLCLPFFLSAILAYGNFSHWWRPTEIHSWRMYVLALLLFALALLAKITAFVLPPTFLLLAWWKQDKLEAKRDVLPALPFFTIAIILGFFIGWLEKHHVGAIGSDFELGLIDRVVLSGQIFWFYVGKIFFPVSLCCIYERWPINSHVGWSWLATAGLAMMVVSLFCLRKRIGRGPMVALLYFIGGLFPVLGFMSVYGMRFSWVADRWVYLPSLAFFALIANRLACIAYDRFRYATMAIVLVALATLTWNQAGTYRSVERFWQAAIDGNPLPWKAENDFGGEMLEQHRYVEAIDLFRRAILHAPNIPDPRANLGSALLRTGNRDEAFQTWKDVLEQWPDYGPVHYNLGILLREAGRNDEAIEHLKRAVEIVPTMSVAHYDLGNSLFLKGLFDEAEIHFLKTLEIRPGHPSADTSMGNVMFVKGKHAEALHYYRRALTRAPNQVEALSNCAWIMSTSSQPELRNGKRAVELGEKCVGLTNESNPGMLSALASAYAEAGRFADAIRTANKAIQLAESQGDGNLVGNLRNEMTFYSENKPFRDDAAVE